MADRIEAKEYRTYKRKLEREANRPASRETQERARAERDKIPERVRASRPRNGRSGSTAGKRPG